MVSEAPFGLAALRATADVPLFAPHLIENAKGFGVGFHRAGLAPGFHRLSCESIYGVQTKPVLLVLESPDINPFVKATLSWVESPCVDCGIWVDPVPRRSMHDWLYACLCIVDFSPHSVWN